MMITKRVIKSYINIYNKQKGNTSFFLNLPLSVISVLLLIEYEQQLIKDGQVIIILKHLSFAKRKFFSPRFYEFKSKTSPDWSNHMVLPKRSHVTLNALNIEKSREQD